MLQLQNVYKAYDTKPVLQIERFNFGQGLYWLQGANGAGKSTLLKCIAGIIPYKGDILLHGLMLKKNAQAYKMAISYQAAEATLPHFLTGQNMVDYYSELKKADKAHNNFVFEALGIESFLHQKIATYSSGMQKKLALALAFIGHNKLIMLDEPLTTVDVESCKNFIALIKHYYQNGTGFIITSHQNFNDDLLQFGHVLQLNNGAIHVV